MKKVTLWLLQIAAALILLQASLFKFTAHPDSVQVFTELNMEPAGRMVIGICELIAGLLLLMPTGAVYGAVLGSGVMLGAIIGHITVLGFDGPRLWMSLLAVAVLMLCFAIIVIRRTDLPILKHMFEKAESA